MKTSRTGKRPVRPVDGPAIAAAAIASWELLRSRLAPIIGDDGFRILFARSLHRTRATHPWLAREPLPAESPLSTLQASLAAQPPERAAEATRALRTHFNELLHALIGEGLATRLIGRA